MSLTLMKKRPVPQNDELSALVADVQTLRRDVAKALRRALPSRSESWESASAIAGQLGERASDFYRDAARRGVKGFRALNRQFRDQPVASMVVAFGVGLLISRLTRSNRD